MEKIRHEEIKLSFNEILKKIDKEYDKETFSTENLNKILNQINEGHQYIIRLFQDKNNYERLKYGKIFDGHIDNDKRGWLASHSFPITLEILNKERIPGHAVHIPSMGGSKTDLLVYHALCPELENFVSLIVWLNSQSSKNAWNQILELIEKQNDTKVLQFSERCGIELPNTVHPSNDRDAKLIEKIHYDSLYDWRFAYYLFDDGKTIMSFNSPLNFRRVILDEWTQEESFVGIRTTIGRLSSIKDNSIEVWTPCLNDKPRKWEWKISKSFDKSSLIKNRLYFFKLYKKSDENNVSTFVKETADAEPIDIIWMFLSQSLYLLYLGTFRLKLLNSNQFEKLFCFYYEQISNFCSRSTFELSSISKLNWKLMKEGVTQSFTLWIDDELYFLPPILRRYMSKFNNENQKIIIKQFDQSLYSQNHNCFEKNPYDKNGNRLFSSQRELAKLDRIYDFTHFLLRSKRLILGIEQNPNQMHFRDEHILWLKNKINV